MYSGAQSTFFVCLCVQSGRTSKQVVRWCVSYSCIWFSVSSVRVGSSELSRGLSMECFMHLVQMLLCIFNPYTVAKIQFPLSPAPPSYLFLRWTSMCSLERSCFSCKSLPRHEIPTNLGFIWEEVWYAVQMAAVKIRYQYQLICD